MTEGKFSFPILHAVRNGAQDPLSSGNSLLADAQGRELLSILRQRTKEKSVKEHAVKIMREKGSFDYTRQTLLRVEGEARREIQRLGGNAKLERILDTLSTVYKDA